MSLSSKEIKDLAGQVIMNTYGDRYELALVRGDGCLVYDAEGNEYLDFVAGLAVTALGHSHAGVTEAVCRQAGQLIHVSNLFFTEPQVLVAKMLTDLSFADRVFFCNSGAEANEAAMKLARKYSFEKYGPGRFKVVTMEHSFHGRTMATMAATAQEKIQKGFTPLMDGFVYVPLGDLKALEKALTDEVCAVLIEPIQGEGGVNAPPEGYLEEMSALCRKKDVLVIFDEVQVGMGRTGKLFAYQNFGIEPDIMSLAKALANGLPMGAALAREEVARVFTPGAHGSTFGGTPLVCAACLATLEAITAPGFLEQVVRVGDYLKAGLKDIAKRRGFVRQVRGMGLILGMELDFAAAGVLKALRERGILINVTRDDVLRFLPPLIVTEAEVDRLLPVLEEVLVKEASA